MKFPMIFITTLLAAVLNAAAANQPNIVFILADDYGWNDVGYHGSEIKTPNLDQLAADGIKLENYYVQSLCTPSRSNLLAGWYTSRLGLQHFVILPCQNIVLPFEEVTLPQRLKALGYDTHMVGKWHLGDSTSEALPTNRGFDSFFGYLNGAEHYYNHSFCFNQKCGYDMRVNATPSENFTGQYSTHLFTEQASQVLESSDPSKPFFLYMAYQAVHAPLEVPESYANPYDHIKDKNRRLYAGMVAAMDEGIGNLTITLKKQGLWNNTLIIFSTDNGGMLPDGGNNAPLRGMKGTLFEGGVRGIGFISGPKAEAKGMVNKELLHISDWYPTLVKLAGGKIPVDYSLDGFDQWATINRNQSSPREEILFNIDPLFGGFGKSASEIFDTGVQAGLRMGNFKIITGNPVFDKWAPEPDDRFVFPWYLVEWVGEVLTDVLDWVFGRSPKNVWVFDAVNDPEERNDLSQTHPDILEKLLMRLAYYNSTAVPVQNQTADPRCDPVNTGGFWGPWADQNFE